MQSYSNMNLSFCFFKYVCILRLHCMSYWWSWICYATERPFCLTFCSFDFVLTEAYCILYRFFSQTSKGLRYFAFVFENHFSLPVFCWSSGNLILFLLFEFLVFRFILFIRMIFMSVFSSWFLGDLYCLNQMYANSIEQSQR